MNPQCAQVAACLCCFFLSFKADLPPFPHLPTFLTPILLKAHSHNALSMPFCHSPPHGTAPASSLSLISSLPQNQGPTLPSHPSIPLPAHLAHSTVLNGKIRAWYRWCFSSCKWRRMIYHHRQNKEAARLALSAVEVTRTIIQGKTFIVWSGKNHHTGRAGSC